MGFSFFVALSKQWGILKCIAQSSINISFCCMRIMGYHSGSVYFVRAKGWLIWMCVRRVVNVPAMAYNIGLSGIHMPTTSRVLRGGAAGLGVELLVDDEWRAIPPPC